MKVRSDFVTNSSSSSFIISTNEQVPQGYEDTCKEINQDNLYEIFREKHEWDSISYGYDEELKKEANLTDEQMLLVKMAVQGDLDEYLELKEKTKQTDQTIYKIFVDRDWLYYQDRLQDFINNSNIIRTETDF